MWSTATAGYNQACGLEGRDLLRRIYSRFTQDPRLQRILHGSFTGLIGRGVGLLGSVIALPLTVHYLGAQEYGIWVTVSGSVAMLTVLDLGLASTLTNRIAEAGAQDDEALAQRYYATAFWLTAAISLCLGSLVLFALHRIDWMKVFHLTSPQLASSAADCVAIACLATLAGLPLNLVSRVLGGYQQAHVANYFSMATNILSLGAIVAGILLHLSLVHLMLCYCATLTLGLFLLNVWFSVWSRPGLKPVPWRVRPRFVKNLFREGSLFFIIQLCNIVVFNSDNLVITHYLGPEEVTPYSIAWRLFTYATLLQGVIVPSVWPALTDAYHRGDAAWLRSTYRSLTRKTIVFVGALALLLGVGGRQIIRFWIGPAAVPAWSLMWLMAAWAVLVAVTSNQATLLTATGKLRVETTTAVLAAIVNLFLSIYLVQHLGSRGVILATILSFLIIMVGPQELAVRNLLSGLDGLMPQALQANAPVTRA